MVRARCLVLVITVASHLRPPPRVGVETAHVSDGLGTSVWVGAATRGGHMKRMEQSCCDSVLIGGIHVYLTMDMCH